MASKPTYRDLEQRVRELENEVFRLQEVEKALSACEAQKGAILDASPDRILYVARDMRIIWVNKITALSHGMSVEDMLGRHCYEVFVGRDTPCEGCATVRAQESGKIERSLIHHPKMVRMIDGTDWDSYSIPVKNGAGEVEGFIQIGRDITRREQAEKRVHALSQQLLKAHEDERQRISLYLHDHVGQELSLIKMGCETLLDDHPYMPPEIKDRLARISEIVHGTISAVRTLAYDLHPAGLDQFGLVDCIFQFCQDFAAATGLKVDFQAAGLNNLQLDPEIEINVYRLLEEALHNIQKHAEAQRVVVRLVASYPNIILRIEDDGRGFDVVSRLLQVSGEKRMGLRSMEERVHFLNGKFKIQSRLMVGTNICIEIPLKEKTGDKQALHPDH